MKDKEFQILMYIKEHSEATTDAIIANFGSSAEIRLQYLLSMNMLSHNGFFDNNGMFQDFGTYILTDIGHMFLEDYLHEQGLSQRAKWEDRTWKFIPIVISSMALIVAIVSLAQALHWIDLAR